MVIALHRLISAALLAIVLVPVAVWAQALPAPVGIERAVVGDLAARTAEVSTDDLRRILTERTATVFDARPFREFAVSHIPGARNLAAKPGVPMSVYVSDVSEIGRITGGDKTATIVLYCNGPHCGKSKRLADELLAADYTNVRRYQLGIPVWRALGGVCEIEPDGLRHVLENDRTAVVVDARETEPIAPAQLPAPATSRGPVC